MLAGVRDGQHARQCFYVRYIRRSHLDVGELRSTPQNRVPESPRLDQTLSPDQVVNCCLNFAKYTVHYLRYMFTRESESAHYTRGNVSETVEDGDVITTDH